MSCLPVVQDTLDDRSMAAFPFDSAGVESVKPTTDALGDFALSSMSSDHVDFPGWVHHRSGEEDLYTSPLFTDTSPCLTDHSSFEPGSCDPSPLLANDLDAPVNEAAHMPLFGDMTLFSPHQTNEQSFDRSSASSVGTTSALPANFSLFPDVNAPPSPPRGQMAFNPSATEPQEDATAILLRALQGIANTHAQAQQAQPPVHSASPKLLTGDANHKVNSTTRSTKPTLHHSATAPVLSRHSRSFEGDGCASPHPDDCTSVCGHSGSETCTSRGTKRRLCNVDDLLPIDAPIQARNYLGPSSTSRKDWVPPSDIDAGPSPEELAAIQAESDPLKAKRLSNTLAARRSRHRKAAERAEFLARIQELEQEVGAWKKRCERAEKERDAALAVQKDEGADE